MRKEPLLLFTSSLLALALLVPSGVFPQQERTVYNPSTSKVPYRERYTIVVSSTTNRDWGEVVEALKKKHPSAILLTYTNSPSEVQSKLSEIIPRYVAFLAKPEEVSEGFVRELHTLMRNLDDDPYYDAFFGIITGYAQEDAQRMIKEDDPFFVRKALIAFESPSLLQSFREGMCFSEGSAGKGWIKKKGSKGVEALSDVPSDVTKLLVETLNSNTVDLFATSGHATEHNWQVAYTLSAFGGKTGYFIHRNGTLIGRSADGKEWEIHTTNPKIFWPAGNCLIGHIDRRDCMMTSWFHSGGVVQSIGYIVPTWYGYGGWGIGTYFIGSKDAKGNRGFYTFAESFLSNCQSLIFDLERHKNGEVTLAERDLQGHQYDRDAVAFYGDPAWRAYVLKDGTTDWDYVCELKVDKLGGKRFRISLMVKFKKEKSSFDRLLVAYPAWRIDVNSVRDVRANAPYIITDSFIGLSPWKQGDPSIEEGKTFTLSFSASPLDPVP